MMKKKLRLMIELKIEDEKIKSKTIV